MSAIIHMVAQWGVGLLVATGLFLALVLATAIFTAVLAFFLAPELNEIRDMVLGGGFVLICLGALLVGATRGVWILGGMALAAISP